MARATLYGDRKECIEACLDCYRSCTETAMTHCLPAGEHVEPGHFRLMVNCADICRTTASFMLSESEFDDRICTPCCVDVCEACADSCRAIGGMDDCVAACELCADSCAAMTVPGKPMQRESALTHPKSLLP